MDCETTNEFENKVKDFYDSLSFEKELKSFIQYFKNNKEEVIKYHVIKKAVQACDIKGLENKFYNNSIESMNNLIKRWQNYNSLTSQIKNSVTLNI